MKIKCDFCGKEQERKQYCASCGAPFPENPIQKREPFFYKGFFIWPERNYARDLFSFYFYRGERLIHVLNISGEVIDGLTADGYDSTSRIFDLFKVATGEVESVAFDLPYATLEIKRTDKRVFDYGYYGQMVEV